MHFFLFSLCYFHSNLFTFLSILTNLNSSFRISRSLFEKLICHYAFDCSDFFKNLINFTSSESHYNEIFSNRFEKRSPLLKTFNIYFDNFFNDSSNISIPVTLFTLLSIISRFIFAFCGTFSNKNISAVK